MTKVGVISKVLSNSRYIVYFRESYEEVEFEHSNSRLHQDWIDGKWIVASRALQLGQDANSPFGFNGQRCQMCLRSDPLHKVMERLANPVSSNCFDSCMSGVRRLVIVEAGSKRVEGIISLSDVFKFLLGV
ncbi:hypothetical protein EZV62_006734 [Acer yangbiense]|uniref:Uncharacterized protein n=1 Tax=Acer yangbiense TaxID=1000413 RepID=A0A5C7I9N6_9ROSI|nr:hypothetical protein EZV62_006734 [Acer yangbiense]